MSLLFRDRNLSLIFLILFIVLVGFGIVIPILPYYARELGASSFQMGLLVTLYAFAQFLSGPFWGSLSDRIGRKPVLLFGLVGLGFCFILMGLSRSYTMLLTARVLAGILAASPLSTAQAYVADLTDSANRAEGMAVAGTAQALGFIFGPVIGGTLAPLGITVPFFLGGSVTILTALGGLIILPESRSHLVGAVSAGGSGGVGPETAGRGLVEREFTGHDLVGRQLAGRQLAEREPAVGELVGRELGGPQSARSEPSVTDTARPVSTGSQPTRPASARLELAGSMPTGPVTAWPAPAGPQFTKQSRVETMRHKVGPSRLPLTRVIIYAAGSPASLFFWLAFVLMFSHSSMFSMMSYFLMDRVGAGESVAGLAFGLQGATSAAVQALAVGPVNRRFGDELTVLGALVLGMSGYLLLARSTSLVGIFTSIVIPASAVALLRPTIASAISRRTVLPQGITMGIQSSFDSLGRTLGPLWAGFVYGYDTGAPFLTAALVYFAGFVMAVVYRFSTGSTAWRRAAPGAEGQE